MAAANAAIPATPIVFSERSDTLETCRNADRASFRDGLLRLTMAGFYYLVFGPTGFWTGIALSELNAKLLTVREGGFAYVE